MVPTTILIIEDDDAIIDLFVQVVRRGVPGATVLHAASGSQALELVRAQSLDLVILDIRLAGPMSGREVALKIRALRPALPILPCTGDLDSAAVLADLGCAPAVAKQQLARNPFQLIAHIRAAGQIPPVTRVPTEAFNYMLERADAALAEELRQAQVGVVMLCRHPLLRIGLARAITGLGITVAALAAHRLELLQHAEAALRASLILGTVGDLAEVEAVGIQLRRPRLVVATQPAELGQLSWAQLMGCSVVVYAAQEDVLQLLAAIHAATTGRRFIAVPPGALAQWVAPPGAITPREWEVLIATLLLPDRAAVAQACGVTAETVETYGKRIRRALAPRSWAEICDLARAHLVRHLGVLPVATVDAELARAVGEGEGPV